MLRGTMFDFFQAVNVLEFKGQSDQLTLREYVRNDLRTDLALLQSKDDDFTNILNVIVTSRWPQTFFEQAEKWGIVFQPEKEKPWLRKAQVGFQNVALVICRDLPLEEPYYSWLAFTPAGTRKWKDFLRILLIEGKAELLDTIRQMRPKEFKVTTKDLIQQLEAEGKIPHQEPDEEMEQLMVRVRQIAAYFRETLGKLTPEERMAGLKPEDRLKGLKTEDRLKGLKPEDRLKGLSTKERQELLKLLLEENKEEQTEE